MILIIDNYDSFTYNLVQYFGSINSNIEVYKNDNISIEEIKSKNPRGIVISPGPGRPENAGISINVIQKFGKEIPILGICLGHQAIALAFNGNVTNAGEIMHGKRSLIKHKESLIFKGVPKEFFATRYHSLVILKNNFPDDLIITSTTISGLIMSLEHKKYPIFGIQFHPESIVTEYGMKIVQNFLAIVDEYC
jgi:anthranilate synthase/aminodeoxychorismate synthase-like glutamine amidotransferase